MKKMLSFMSGVMMGAVFGATLALLFAPSSGDDLRMRVREEADRVQEEVKKAAAERRAELEAQLDAMRAPQPAN
jgi:gas vesicle protein